MQAVDGIHGSDPVRVLMEERDPILRGRAHVELGRRAAARQSSEVAARHYLEALSLDPTDEVARTALDALGLPAAATDEKSMVGRLWSRLTRR